MLAAGAGIYVYIDTKEYDKYLERYMEGLEDEDEEFDFDDDDLPF